MNWPCGPQLPVDSSQNPAAGARVEKLMSITRAEFEMGLARLYDTPARMVAQGRYEVLGPASEFPALMVQFDELPKAVLGGLMALPRARVTLDLGPLSEPQRSDFLNLFDKTFQRGGG